MELPLRHRGMRLSLIATKSKSAQSQNLDQARCTLPVFLDCSRTILESLLVSPCLELINECKS